MDALQQSRDATDKARTASPEILSGCNPASLRHRIFSTWSRPHSWQPHQLAESALKATFQPAAQSRASVADSMGSAAPGRGRYRRTLPALQTRSHDQDAVQLVASFVTMGVPGVLRVQALASMMDSLDKQHLRGMQKEMFTCSAHCCDDTGTQEDLQRWCASGSVTLLLCVLHRRCACQCVYTQCHSMCW